MTSAELKIVLEMSGKDFFFRFGKLNITHKKEYEHLVSLRKQRTYPQVSEILDVFGGEVID